MLSSIVHFFLKNQRLSSPRPYKASRCCYPASSLWISMAYHDLLHFSNTLENDAQILWTCSYGEKHNVWKSVWAHFIVIDVIGTWRTRLWIVVSLQVYDRNILEWMSISRLHQPHYLFYCFLLPHYVFSVRFSHRSTTMSLQSRQKNLIGRFGYNEYMGHHYAFMMKVMADQESKSYKEVA